MPLNLWSLETIVEKPIIRADISIMISSTTISATPRSELRSGFTSVILARMAVLCDLSNVLPGRLFVPIDVRQLPQAHDRGQMGTKVVTWLERHRLGTHADMNRHFPNLIRGIDHVVRGVREVVDCRRVDRSVHDVVLELKIFH